MKRVAIVAISGLVIGALATLTLPGGGTSIAIYNFLGGFATAQVLNFLDLLILKGVA